MTDATSNDFFKLLFRTKAARGLTFEQIAQAMNKDEVWVAALFYGQAKASEEELLALGTVLQFTPNWITSQLGPQWYPNRGIGPVPPTDPVIYRLFEAVLVYGHAIKVRWTYDTASSVLSSRMDEAIIHEKFGDGIMSMIDCKIHVDRKEDPRGDRVVLTFDGKFQSFIGSSRLCWYTAML